MLPRTCESFALLDDFEGGALAVARGGAVQHRPDRVNRLAVAANDAADVGLAQLHFKDRHFAARNFREHHVVGKFDELTNDELEKFFHHSQIILSPRIVTLGARLLLEVGAFEIFRVLANRADLFAVRTKQPEPIVTSAADEVAML